MFIIFPWNAARLLSDKVILTASRRQRGGTCLPLALQNQQMNKSPCNERGLDSRAGASGAVQREETVAPFMHGATFQTEA